MVWFKVDDKLHSHVKAMRAGAEAMGLWVLAGSWAADHLTDGWVPDYAAVRLSAHAEQDAERLVAAGLWVPGEHEGDKGWWFHDWAENGQPTRVAVMAERQYNARKTALHRDPALVEAVRARDADRCRYCGTHVVWKDRRSEAGATYDHVNPFGPNVLANVVVACRGCNSRKGQRTPEQAGMPLLSPASLGPTQVGSSSYLDTTQDTSGSVPVFFQSPTRPDPNQVSTSRGELISEGSETLPDASAATEKPSRRRATRLPADFKVTPEMVAWASTNAPNVNGRFETAQFIDYWNAKSGKDATKTDWVATWRRWMREAEQRAARATSRRRSTADEWKEALGDA